MNAIQSLLLAGISLLLLGCPTNYMEAERQAKVEAEEKAAEAAAAEAEKPKGNIITRPAELVDRNKWMAEHPTWVELEKNEAHGTGPISAPLQAGRAAIGKLNISTFEHDIELWKNMPGNEGKWPTYDEYSKILDRHGATLKGGLKPGQVYGYNDQNGQITILSPPEKAGQ